VKAQDLEPVEAGGVRLRQGVAPDRCVSIEDAQMRHGRKSKSKRFNGYKQDIGTHANRPEEEATPELKEDLRRLGVEVDALFIDRAYVNSELAEDVKDFAIDVKAGTMTCPAGQVESFEPGQVVQFDPKEHRIAA
jgi:hypothetical protein